MDFFDFEFDFQDCLGAMLVGMFLLGSMQLHAVLNEQISERADRLRPAQELSSGPVVASALAVGAGADALRYEDYPGGP